MNLHAWTTPADETKYQSFLLTDNKAAVLAEMTGTAASVAMMRQQRVSLRGASDKDARMGVECSQGEEEEEEEEKRRKRKK